MNTVKKITKPVFLTFFMLLMFRIVFRQQLSSDVISIVWISISSMLLGILIFGLILEKQYKRLIILGIILVAYVVFAVLSYYFITSHYQ